MLSEDCEVVAGDWAEVDLERFWHCDLNCYSHFIYRCLSSTALITQPQSPLKPKTLVYKTRGSGAWRTCLSLIEGAIKRWKEAFYTPVRVSYVDPILEVFAHGRKKT